MKFCLHGFPIDLMSLFPADCERKAQAGNVCAASFDRKCNGICKSVEKIMDVHQRCGEDENAIWSASF